MCTNFALYSTKNVSTYAITARTMDFSQNLKTHVCVVPRNKSFPAIDLLPVHNPVKWTNQYGYVGMETVFFEIARGITDGINEVGLSIGELWLPCSQYPKSESATKPLLFNINILDWVLGNFASVAEVKAALNTITVININERIPSARFPTHFVISDSTGANIIIEFMNGAMQVYESDNGIMTNAPDYQWQLNNLTNYVNLSTTNNPIEIWGQQGNGNGCLGMPGDYTPPSRFVRAWMLQQSAQNYTPKNTEEAVGLAARILQNFGTPMGSIVENTPDHSTADKYLDRTQWGVVRDHKEKVYYYFTQFNNNLFSVDLKAIDFSAIKASAMPIAQAVWHTDITKGLIHQ